MRYPAAHLSPLHTNLIEGVEELFPVLTVITLVLLQSYEVAADAEINKDDIIEKSMMTTNVSEKILFVIFESFLVQKSIMPKWDICIIP